ncbi:argininosuccinate lyase [Deferrisoma camini]|uniref:argininosuccinate lyase n=1 Tax=Deferrisoma camini TaxID=1035120 RepID=UPI00046D02FA|nr:argininosuccinate lyase [Deferrisoma camini]
MAEKPWGGRFREETLRIVERFTASIGFDRRMYRQDIRGSIAHARMLASVGILTEEEADTLVRGLEQVLAEIERGELELTESLEDIHMNVEHRLTQIVGPVGGKLHTARSRNDQVALDLRLYLADEVPEILDLLRGLGEVLLERAEAEADLLVPGYTHLQRAQPVTFGHHWLAYFEMFLRDMERYRDALGRIRRSPLGAGALAGSPYPLDRERVARDLGLEGVCRNSLDAVSDRDFALEFLFAGSVVMMHLSRLSEELVLWSSQEFGFIELSDGFCTGSSIMPQKKNPDVPELLRGKTGRAYGNLISLLTTLKALPLAYNKDMQEDKEPVFDTLDTVKGSLAITVEMLRNLKVRPDRARAALKAGFLLATELADYLAAKGVPFRQAHEAAGRLVALAEARGCGLEDLDLETLRSVSPLFEEDVFQVLDPEASVARRTVLGGPAPDNVRREARLGWERLDAIWPRRD